MARFRRLAILAIAALAWLSASTAFAADGKVRGKVEYEKILHRNPDTGVGGLALDRPVMRPVTSAKVALIDVDNKVLAETATDEAGNYTLSWSSPVAPTARIRVFASADNITVLDFYEKERVYSVTSDAWTLPEGDASKDVIARDATRESGPFNIIAAIQIGNNVVRTAEPGIVFPHIRVFWTTRHREGTSYFVRGRNEAYILGDRSVDSDEFDDFIILHEYGHFLSATFSKDNSMGGMHGGGERVDPRLAWGEGWGNFFACAALNNPLYVDTGVNKMNGSAILLEIDLDNDIPNGDRAGYWSEHSAASALWDIFDGRPGKNHLGVGFTEVWKVLRSKQWAELPNYRSIIDFCDILVAMHPELQSPVAEVLAARRIDYTPGKSAHPYLRPLTAGAEFTGEITSIGRRSNMVDVQDVFSLTLTEKKKVKLHMEITASKVPAKSDLDLYLVDITGRVIKISNVSNGVGGTETIEVELPAGRYTVEVRSFFNTDTGTRVENTGSYRIRADM